MKDEGERSIHPSSFILHPFRVLPGRSSTPWTGEDEGLPGRGEGPIGPGTACASAARQRSSGTAREGKHKGRTGGIPSRSSFVLRPAGGQAQKVNSSPAVRPWAQKSLPEKGNIGRVAAS